MHAYQDNARICTDEKAYIEYNYAITNAGPGSLWALFMKAQLSMTMKALGKL